MSHGLRSTGEHTGRPGATGRRWRAGLVALGVGLTALWVAGAAPPEPLVLVISGLAQDTLEPCGCGGQQSGGMARRVAMVQAARDQHPGAVALDLGDYGSRAPYRSVIFRSLARAGVAVGGLSESDLLNYPEVSAEAAASGVPLSSLAPPREGEPPVPVALVEAPGGLLAVVSVAPSRWQTSELTAEVGRQLHELAPRDDVRLIVLLSHLGMTGTSDLLQSIPEAERPGVVVLATINADSLPAFEKDGTWWVPVARRGRSLSVAEVSLGRHPVVRSDQLMVLPGPRDAVVQGWVDEVFAAEQAGLEARGEAALPVAEQPERCAACHAGAVAAWRAHPHAAAVRTLVSARREVARCLTCHSETFRRTGLKPAVADDDGASCATCHGGLAAHDKDPAARPRTVTVADCRGCHTADESPGWDDPAYWASVIAACQGEVRPRVHPAGGSKS